jgi:hypothetical protein
VRLRVDVREEELQEVRVALAPVVAVVLRPPLVRVGAILEGEQGLRPRRLDAERHRGADERDTGDPLGVLGGEQQRPLRAHRPTDDERAVGPGRVEHGERIGRELGLGVGLRLDRPVRAAIPAAVERDHAAVPGQVGDLHLPAARLHDRPGRQQQDGRLALAVDLVEDPDAVALDEALVVGVARPGLLRARTLDR